MNRTAHDRFAAGRRRAARRCVRLSAIALLLLSGPLLSQETQPEAESQPASAPAPAEPNSSPAVDASLLVPPDVDPNALAEQENGYQPEILGLIVQGRRSREQLILDDLSGLLHSRKHMLPIARLARIFEVPLTEENGRLILDSPTGRVTIDVSGKRIISPLASRRVELVEAASEIAGRRDVFLMPEDVASLLGMDDLDWDEAEYAYRARVSRPLEIWKLSWSARQDITHMATDLPELHGLAGPSDDLVHFVENSFDLRYRRVKNDTETTNSLELLSPRHQIWGRLHGGYFGIEIANPGFLYDAEGFNLYEDEPVFSITRFEWVRRYPSYELTLGDITLGLSDLVFPRSRITGVQVAGLIGFDEEELKQIRRMPRLGGLYTQTRLFEGYARLGSRVELRINDRVVEVQEAWPDASAPPDMGIYRFEDIRIPSGVLTQVAIVITEPEGTQQTIKREFVENRLMLPRDHGVYLLAAGSRRYTGTDQYERQRRPVLGTGRLYGTFVGGRFIYGLTDELTGGVAFATEDNLFGRELETGGGVTDDRRYPGRSDHASVNFSWAPWTNVNFSGELAVSTGEGDGRYQDWAGQLGADWYITRNFSVHGGVFRYGPDYFDGSRIDLQDREGGQLSANWRLGPHAQLFGAIGMVRDNLDGAETTRFVRYNTLELTATPIPRVGVTLGTYGAQTDDDEDGPMRLHRVRVVAGPWNGFMADGEIYWPDELNIHDNRLLDGLRLDGTPEQTDPSKSLTLSKHFDNGHSVGFRYRETVLRKRATVYHSVRLMLKNPVDISTEIGRDYFEPAGPYFNHQTEFFLDSRGNSSVGVEIEREDDEWRALAYLSVNTLFTRQDNRIVPVDRRRVYPARGAVRGTVYIDRNCNGVRDEGEPGVEGIIITLGFTRTAVTDAEGFYIVPAPSGNGTTRIAVDMSSVPAIYSVVHGTQEVRIEPYNVTEVDLALTAFISAIGRVLVVDEAGEPQSLSGVTVRLYPRDGDKPVAESVTAGDGSYYFGDLRPGDYVVRVDTASLSKQHELRETDRELHVAPSLEYQEVEGPTFEATRLPPEEADGE